MANIDPKTLDLKEKLVSMNRVAKTVKGGRTMRMAALVVVGDGNGHVGVGLGKAVEFQEAIRKATEDAKKNIVCISTCGTTIPHEAIGKFGKSSVLLMPAPEGTGVIAGGSVRAVIEMAGIRDIRTKSHGSNNPANSVKAALEGLKSLKNAEDFARLRGKTSEEIMGSGGGGYVEDYFTEKPYRPYAGSDSHCQGPWFDQDPFQRYQTG